ncbi:hypothetical protein NUW54_g1830 [Trametes sanguinea]|nr:hypothetical protein NUW54_g1830 [Trametes sanguinea]
MSTTNAAYNLPMALDAELFPARGFRPEIAQSSNVGRHLEDCLRRTLGPMPVELFLKELLPLSPSSDTRGRLASRFAFSGVPQRADSPTRIYEPLLHALNKSTKTKSRCPGFEFVNTHERSRKPLHPGYAKPHICCFTPANAGIIRDADQRSRAEFAYAELFIEVASDPAADYFVDPPSECTGIATETTENPPEDADSPLIVIESPFEVTENARDAAGGGTAHDFVREIEDEDMREEAERTYRLHIAYATELFARQHRLFLFSISLHGSFARFFRWDRAGCLVSAAFDIRKQPDLLTDFLWRFSQLSPAQRGLDTTVQSASVREEKLFHEAVRGSVRLQLEVEGDELEKAVSAHYLPGHTAIIPVTPRRPFTAGDKVHHFIVSRPIVSPLSLPGRESRCFWAVDADTGRVVFLKDCWRFYCATEVEGDILRRLNDLNVRNVPVLAVHGDVPMDTSEEEHNVMSQSTLTEAYLGDSWICIVDGIKVAVQKLWHYRLVTSTVGYSLRSLRGTEELLYAGHDALIAMKDALTKDFRIHRDLSVGNIILVKEADRSVRKGYLIHWEASDRIDDAGEALHSGRAGTWKFMSIRMLNSDQLNGKHTLPDDLEALLYVVLYCALYYLPHNLSPQYVAAFSKAFFDEYRRRLGGVLHGGEAKYANAFARSFTKNVHFRDTVFDEWLQTVMDLHCQRIGTIKRQENLWTLDSLDNYWTQFLETHNLEADNRQVHLPSVDGLVVSCSSSPSSSLSMVAVPTKRRIDEISSPEQQGRKAARLQAEVDMQSPMAPQLSAIKHTGLEPAPSAALRRSERIRSRHISCANTAGHENAAARVTSNQRRASPRAPAGSKKGRALTRAPRN